MNIRSLMMTAVAAMMTGGFVHAADGLAVGKAFDVTPELANGNQRWPAVAFGPSTGSGQGGGCYLVVWQEGEAMAGVADTNIMAARVSADGKPLDGKGFAVCSAKGFQTYPSVAFDGTNFLVAWQDFRGGKDWDVYAARVSPAGKVLDADGLAVAAGPGNQIYPTLASDGRKTLAVWSEIRAEFKPEVYQLYGTFIGDGKVETPGGKELAKAGESLLNPRVAFDGEGYVIAAGRAAPGWSPGAPFFVRVSADGSAAPLKADGFLAQTFCIASDPKGRKVLTWSNERGEHGSYGLWYVIGLITDCKTGAGVRQMTPGFQWRFAPRNDLWCAAAYDGRNFLAVVEQPAELKEGEHGFRNVDILATRIDPATAQPLDVPGVAVKMAGTDFRAVANTKEYKDLMAKGPHGIPVAAEANVKERQPALAAAGEGKSLLVYSRHEGQEKFKIYAAPLSE